MLRISAAQLLPNGHRGQAPDSGRVSAVVVCRYGDPVLADLASPLPSPPVPTPSGMVYQVVIDAGALDWWSLVISVVIGLSTVGTLIWTVLITRREIKISTDERAIQARERDRLHREQERDQASRVVAWSEQEMDLDEVEDDEGNPYLTPVSATRRIWLHNASSAPVYDVRVKYRWMYGSNWFATWEHVVLVPSAEPLEKEEGAIAEHGDARLLLSMTFRDTANRWWRRDEEGNLARVRETAKGAWVEEDADGGWVPIKTVLPVHEST